MHPYGRNPPVEDNPGDVRLMQEAFREISVPHQLNVVETGREALQYFRREGAYSEAPRPDLVLLDLKLPDIHGLEVLGCDQK